MLVGCRRRRGRLRIDVYDTGLGIPSSKKQAIFQEFHRLDQGAKIARGLGLGLSIVERIARVLDHTIAVTSTVGRGSQFSVEVPLSRRPSGARARRATAAMSIAASSPASACCASTTSLAILDGMETLLGGWGCRVVKAADLESALAALAETKLAPDALLVDYHLGEGNGIEAIVGLRRRFAPQLPPS